MNRTQVASQLKSARDEVVDAWLQKLAGADLFERFGVTLPPEGPESLRKSYLYPLFDLLLEYLATATRDYAVVYLDERLRYSPNRAAPEIRNEFFAALLPAHVEAVLDRVSDAADRKDLEQELEALHSGLQSPIDERRLTLLAVGDCLMSETRVFLNPLARQAGLSLDIRTQYFSASQGVSFSPDSLLRLVEESKADLLAFSFLSYEGLPIYRPLQQQCHRMSDTELTTQVDAVVEVMEGYLASLRERTDIPILLHNVCGLPLRRFRARLPFLPPLSGPQQRLVTLLNERIASLSERTPNCLLIDEAEITGKHGIRRSAEPVIPHRISDQAMFHTSRFGSFLADRYLEYIEAYERLRGVKLLLVDFDNTLWKGVMADEAVTHYPERQRLLKKLKETGILLAAVSKNHDYNIRWDEMELSPEDFVALKINWNPKPQSVAEIAEELNLGLNSFVLLDDNPAEREMITATHPAVRAFDALEELTWSRLELLMEFPATSGTKEAAERTAMYRAQSERKQATIGSGGFETMMRGLDLKIAFREATSRDLGRVHELTQRTNQFNTTTIRYSKEDLQRFLQSADSTIYVAELGDKFGQLGIVLTATVKRSGADRITIEDFVMSCRAMGFGLEQKVLQMILERENPTIVVAPFQATARNEPCSRFYQDAGFEADGDGWILSDLSGLVSPPDWFSVSTAGQPVG